MSNGFEAALPALTLAAAATASAAAAVVLPEALSLCDHMERSLSAQGETVESTPRWRIRAITRNADSTRAAELRDLSSDIEVCQADLEDPDSLVGPLAGAFAVFVRA